MDNPKAQKWLERQGKLVHEFYDNDKQLNVDDRRHLLSCFRKQMYAFPLITIPVIIAGIRIPRSFFKNPRLRYVQVISGLTGVFVGSSLSQVVGYQWNLNSLTPDSPSYNCYRILGQTPPQIGMRYYQNTIHHPELAMPDPSTVDWNNSLAFPMCLVFSKKPGVQRPPQHMYQRPDREAEKWRQQYEQNAKDMYNVQDKFDDKNPWGTPAAAGGGGTATNDNQQWASGNSWDRIRKGASITTQPGQSPSPHPGQLTEQQKFDALLDRERLGAAHKDDFADDTKKW